MYKIERHSVEVLKKLEDEGFIHSIHLTRAWLRFLEHNQKAEPVVLALSYEGAVKAYFVGATVKKFGVKILGSPFEGWLTCDMGFIRLDDFEVNQALRDVAKYAFKTLKCFYVRIIDKNIKIECLDRSTKFDLIRDLYLDLSKNEDDLLAGVSKQTKKDIRQFATNPKGSVIKRVPFDERFVEAFYDQLSDVFAKLNRKPNYPKAKMLDLALALKDEPEKVYALQFLTPEEVCVASVLSLGFGNWGASLASASYKAEQRAFRPNEKIRWETIKYWREQGCEMYDMCGYREYKLKFNPLVVEVPAIYFERFPGIHFGKNAMKKLIASMRVWRGKLCGVKK